MRLYQTERKQENSALLINFLASTVTLHENVTQHSMGKNHVILRNIIWKLPYSYIRKGNNVLCFVEQAYPKQGDGSPAP
jgi:hypothetical protein